MEDFFSKCDQMCRKHLLKKSLMENFIFCVVLSIYLHASLWCFKRFYKGLEGLRKTF